MNRRQLLRLGGVTAVGALAGCSAPTNSDRTQQTNDGGESEGSATEDAQPTVSGPPGGDQLGGAETLAASAEVTATRLSADEGAGRYVYSPAIVWLEPGGSITWTIETGSHSITAYHPDTGKTQRIPNGASSFDSGVLSGGATFSHTFETEGVYNYYCTPHEGLGMVGLVVVGGPQGGPGANAPGDVELSAAADSLSTLLSTAGVTSDG